jgi:hypothetical protein
MTNTLPALTVDAAFFEPLAGLVAASPHTRPCPEYPDDLFVRLGVQRVLETSGSGRAFLQEHGVRFADPPGYANYFAALKSARRCGLLRDVHDALLATATPQLPDRLADIAELADYECLAADGHWHRGAVHDPRHAGMKMAVGHFYSLDLRRHTLRHLAAGQGLHEHDMTALKRVNPRGLRHGVPKGRRVVLVYDKAGIDFAYWKRCRQECAVYFLSRVKEGMVYDWLEDRPLNAADPRQRGVTADRRVMTREGQVVRRISYTDPVSGVAFEFLTNEPDLSPGVIVELYRRRWEAEKVFDQIKNKLGEQKAWATSLAAKTAQAQLIALTHNLLLLYECQLEAAHGVTNVAEDQRRAKRTELAGRQCATTGKPLSPLVLAARRATQRSVKFIRWLRHALRDQLAEACAVPRLRTLYASL